MSAKGYRAKPRRRPQLALPLEHSAADRQRGALLHAFTRARLKPSGIDFAAVYRDPAGKRLLEGLARNYGKGLIHTAEHFARRILDLKGELQ